MDDNSSKAATRIVLSIDATFFEIVYLSLTALPSAIARPAAALPIIAGTTRVSPAPFASSTAPSEEDATLVRCPSLFFASSHADGWETQQLRRLQKLCPAANGSPGGGNWLETVLHSIVRQLGTSGEEQLMNGGAPPNALFALWRERGLEAIDLLHGGGVAAGRPAARFERRSCM